MAPGMHCSRTWQWNAAEHKHQLQTCQVIYLLKAKALLLSVSLHESHEPVPLKSTSHDVSGFDSVWLPVYKFGLNVYSVEVSFIIYHEQACNISELF